MFFQVYAAALLAIFAQSAFAAQCSRTYKVVEGDYCDKISQTQKVSTYQLAVLNPALINKGCSNLNPGEEICLGVDGEDCTTTHIVGQDDTCYDIAAANGLNMTIFHLNNPQLGAACDIYIGEVVCTAKTVQVPAVPSSGVAAAVGGSTPSTHHTESSILTPPPTKTQAPQHATSPPASAPAPSSADDDNDNLPFCDEL